MTVDGTPGEALSAARSAIVQFGSRSGERLGESTPGWENVADLYECVSAFWFLTEKLPTTIERLNSSAQAATLAGTGPFDRDFGAEGAKVLMQEARDAFARASRHAIMLEAEMRAAADLIIWAYDVGASN